MNNIIQTIRHAARAAAVLLLALCAAQTAWAWDGQGTEAEPYKITSADDLATIRTNVNGGTTYENVYFKQTADITLSGTCTPIGTKSNPFKGRYDGGDHKITGLRITATDSQYAGLFGYIEGGKYNGIEANTHIAEVHGVVLVDPTITITATGSEKYAGAIVGCAGDCSRIYDNTVIGGTVTYTGGSNYNTDYSYVGGIVGSYVNSNFPRLSGNTVVGTTLSGAGISGGLVGLLNNRYQFSGNFADASISGADYRTAGIKRQGALVGSYNHQTSSFNGISVNYYHSASGLTAYGSNYTYNGSSYSLVPVADNEWVEPLYTVSAPSGLTVSGTPAATHDGKGYYAEGAVLTIGTGSADKVFSGFTATGATASSLAADRRSATVTVGTADVTVSATLQTVSGTTADGLTWSLAQDDSGNYTRLTVGGNGAMQNYSHITDGKTTTWRTTAPWGYGLTSVTVGDGVTAIGSYAFIGSLSLAAATIGSSVATIGQQAFDHCDALVTVTLPASVTALGQGVFYNCIGLKRIDILHDGAVSLAANVFYNDNDLQYITFPSPAALQANTTGNWSTYAAKLRVTLGSQLFTATTEGGTPAYQIATADDLRNLAAAVNATGNYASTGKTFRQTADIDLAGGGNFTPIGSLGGGYRFAGTYDGGGHTISGLTVSIAYGDIGLFGVVMGGTVRNVILLSPNVNATTTLNYVVNLGALIGMCDVANNRVENCHVVNPTVSSSSTSSRNYVGAIIGNIWDPNTTVTNCYYYGGNANAAYGNNPNGATVTRVCAAHRVTLADGVTIQTPMAAVLGFTCDADNNGTAENYWRTGAQLTLGYTGTVPAGYTIGYTATNGGTISGSTLTMPDGDVTVTATVSVTPWDGDGSEGNPYLIKYPSQLDLLAHRVNGTNSETANGYSGAYFQLAKDITYDYTGLGDSDSNYEAIGGYYDGNYRSFCGHFDGNKKTISGIRIYKGGNGYADSYQGIFGLTDGADIHDLTLADARITGYGYTGGIVGYNDGGTIEQCTSAVTLTIADATKSMYYGGIAGYNENGTLRDNLAIGATVPAAKDNSYGAITGYNDGGTLQRNYYAACKVANTENATGVGCGYINDGNGGHITADVTADNGAVSIHTLTLADGITTSTPVTVTIGTTGYYAQGTAIALSYGGTTGEGYQLGIVRIDGNGFTAAVADGDGHYTAVMPAANATATDHAPIDWATITSGDSEDDPYIIYNKDQLDLLAHRVNGTHGETRQTDGYENKFFQLANDITYDYTGLGDSDSNYEAIGGDYGGNRYFRGHFDGNNKTISGIRIYRGGSSSADKYQGIFGRTYFGADIHDLTLADARITGYDHTGGIVGRNDGATVTRCHVADDVAVADCAVLPDASWHGGIVGNNYSGTIEQCTSAATLTLTNASKSRFYGGIAGYNENGTLSDNLAIGATVPAAANNTYGAITGYNFGTLQRNYYAACKVADVENATGVGCAKADVTDNDGAMPGYLLTLGEGVTSSALSITIPKHKELDDNGQLATVAAVTYNVAAAGTTVWFKSDKADGYSASYSVNGSPVSGNSITMPAANVTVTSNGGESIDLWDIAGGADGSSDHPYTITTTEGWNLLAGNVAAGKSYSGKHFQLGADNISISTMVGTSACHFSGHFNGNGNTLAVSMTSAGEYTAPFRYVGGATITGLHTTGTVTTAHKCATGLVGRHDGNVTISNCRSSVAIVSSVSGDGTHGGLVATGSGTATIEGCLFDGVICTTASDPTNSCGGFVGWNGGTVNISNSLYAPASVPEGKHAIGTDGCATFARNGVNSIANSYYTQTLGDTQGKACHSVTAGGGVTIDAIALTGDATEYTVSGITAYSGGGLQRGETLYYGSSDEVSLTLSNTATGDAPAGYRYDGYTASAGTISGSTLIMPDQDVTISVLRSTGVTVPVTYVDAGGNTVSGQSAIALDGTETDLGIYDEETWYFVGTDIAFGHRLNLYGNVHLILADGCTMNVTSSDYEGIDVDGSLTIYGQTDGTGTLNATSGYYGIYTDSGTITISGGTVTATGDTNGIYTNSGTITISGGTVTVTSGYYGINTDSGTITISGGRVTATGDFEGIHTVSGNITISGGRVTVTGENGDGIVTYSGTITLGCTTASDFIYVSRYHVVFEGTLNIADGQMLFDEDGNPYSGTLYDYPYGKTLRPGLTARQAPDGNFWTTYYNSTLGFTIDEDENACAYTATYGDGKLTLHKLGKEIPAGTAVIIVAENNVVSMTATDLPAYSGTNDLRGVDVDTDVDDLGTGTFYVLGMTTVGNEQHFGFHRYTGEEMAAHKAFVLVSNGQALARSLTMVFDEASGIESLTPDAAPKAQAADHWFTLDGRRLQAKPTAPGIYVNNGRKVVIK